MSEQGKGLYDHQYQRFREDRTGHDGYDFQQGPVGNQPPPRVSFRDKLRWWTLDRWKRRKTVMAERDRFQREILDIKRTHPRNNTSGSVNNDGDSEGE